MKLHLSPGLLAAPIWAATRSLAADNWAPDWGSGTSNCLNIGNSTNNGHYKSTAASCCDTYYAWDKCACYANTATLSPCTGSGQWYLQSVDQKCVQDCPVNAANATCGGIAQSHNTKYATALACCKASMSYIVPGVCEADSLGVPYYGTGKWYVDYENAKCAQDCTNTTNAACGGIIESSSVSMFDDAAKCCAATLSYMNKDLCASFSDPMSPDYNGTGDFYVDTSKSQMMCYKDAEASNCTGTNTTCQRAGVNTQNLYTTASDCCKKALSWVPEEICIGLTSGVRSLKWFVDYSDSVCRQDCANGNFSCADPAAMESIPNAFYADAKTCCSNKLSWLNSDICVTISEIGLDNYNGTSKWYASTEDNYCVKDCENATDLDCGGILDAQSNLKTYADAKACCSAHFSWIDNKLCESISMKGNTTWTDLYYPSRVSGENHCVKHCDENSADTACGGDPTDLSVKLYTTAEACCVAHFGWISKDFCVAETNGTAFAGSSLYYVDWNLDQCAKDCPETSTDPACGGVLTESWQKAGAYATKELCCARLSWLADKELCVKGSTKSPTRKPTAKPTVSPTTSKPTVAPTTSAPTQKPTQCSSPTQCSAPTPTCTAGTCV